MSSIPGTRKAAVVLRRRRDPGAMATQASMLAAGALHCELWLAGECTVIAAREPYSGVYRWHVSVAHPSRYPTWDELKTVVYWPGAAWAPQPGKANAQLLGPVAAGEWVNAHDNCFHLYEVDDPLR